MIPACEQANAPGVKRPRLRLSVPTLNISRLSSSLSSPRKEKEKVSSSGRGGLGNIRATKSQQFETGSSALSPTSLSSVRTTSAHESGSSAASLYSVSTGVDKRISTSTTRSKLSWNRSTGCLVSGDVGLSQETQSYLGSPTSPYAESQGHGSLFSTNSVNTFGVSRAPKSNSSTPSKSPKSPTQGQRSPASLEYARHLAGDIAMRAEEKRRRSTDVGFHDQGNGAPVQKVRTGRGGAGVYTKINMNVDAGLFPTTAALTYEHELRLAAQERLLIEASRARAAAARRTGRGGLGNVGSRKLKEKRRPGAVEPASAKMSAKAKGKRRRNSVTVEDIENDDKQARRTMPVHATHRRSGSFSSNAGSISKRRSVRSKTSTSNQKKGLDRLWSSVTSMRSKRIPLRSKEPVEFEIVGLKSDVEYERPHTPVTPESDTMSCIISASAAASANRALALARLDRRSHKAQLGGVPEEDAWFDDDGWDPVSCGGVTEGKRLERLDTGRTRGKVAPGSMCRESRSGPGPNRRRYSRDTTLTYSVTNVGSAPAGSRDSVGTFGVRRKSTTVEEEDDDDDESIVDPYMHGG